MERVGQILLQSRFRRKGKNGKLVTQWFLCVNDKSCICSAALLTNVASDKTEAGIGSHAIDLAI